MLDKLKLSQVRSGLIDISRTYGKPKFIITSDKVYAEDLIGLSRFVGKYSLDDLSLLEKVNELLKTHVNVLIVAEGENVNVYYC